MPVTFGGGSAPSQVTLNLDSLFGTSLAAYRKKLIDNIGATNAFFHEVLKGELYKSQDGGAYIQIPAMYALQNSSWYDGYDELATIPVDGVTDTIWQWRQIAAAIVYSMKEVKQNKQRLISLVETRIKQAEMGLQEGFSQALMWGSATQGGTLKTPFVDPVTGATAIEPLWSILSDTPTASVSVGNINQSTSVWWRNKYKDSVATTYDAFMLEVDQIFNTCALGQGGKPKLVLCDQTSYELFVHAVYQKYRYTANKVDESYPFENILYKGAHFVLDDKVPDLDNGIVPTITGGSGDPASLTAGTMGFINPEFFNMTYESDSDFKMLEDDKGATFFKPTNGDSRVGHVAWMGNITCSSRRKQGVMDGIARTLTTP